MEYNITDAVNNDLEKVRKIISNTGLDKSLPNRQPSETLYKVVNRELRDDTRLSDDQNKYLSIFETATAVFRTAAVDLRKAMDVYTLEERLNAKNAAAKDETDPLRREIADSIMFSNRYALAFAGHVGLNLLGVEPATVDSLYSFDKLDPSKDQEQQTAMLARRAVTDFNTALEARKKNPPVTDEDLKDTLAAMFTAWRNQFRWDTFKDVADKHNAKDALLKYDNFSVNAGDFKRSYNAVIVDDRFMSHRKEDIIGESELGLEMWKSLKKASAYSHEEKSNPHKKVVDRIFTFGSPGCGKTFTAHGTIQSWADICRAKGIPFRAWVHSPTDFGSKYQNETPKLLAQFAKEINDFPGHGIVYIADVDTVFFDRNSPDIRAEQKQTQAVYFQMLDGTLVKRNGKVIWVMDANYVDSIDDATKSRVMSKVVEFKRFSKPEDFAQLSRKTIEKSAGNLKINENEWNTIGKYILDTPLSNREVDSVLSQIVGDYDIPDDLIGAPKAAHLDFIKDKFGYIDTDFIIQKFDDYITNRRNIEMASHIARKQASVTRWLTDIATPAPNAANDSQSE